MIDKLIKGFYLVALVIFFAVLSSGCEKAKKADCTSTTIETTIIETEETIKMNGEFNDLNPYWILEEKTFNKLGDLFKDNKEVFTHTANLMLSQEVDTSVSYDLDNHSIDDVVVFDDSGLGHSVDADNVFSESERALLLSCLKIMADIAPEDTQSISIRRDTSSSFYPLGVDFMFRSELNMDYGYIFTEYPFSSYKTKIADNWYTYIYGLV